MREFFNPRSVAVIGVSESPENMGRNIIANLIEFNYDGITHEWMFSFPKHLRKALATGGRVISDGKPLYLNKG